MSQRGTERGRTFSSLLIEVFLVSLGVFLALLANNWNEDREHRARSKAALRNFVGEMETNRAAVRAYREYHQTLEHQLRAFLQSKEPPNEERLTKEVHFEGVRPVIFEHTAWDLALATQALSYIESDLAFAISRVYTKQNAFQTVQTSFLTSAFTPASMSGDNVKGFVTSMATYLSDVNVLEPEIVSQYDKVLLETKRALDAGKN